jgi:DNA-binding LacI/PurR family transcriptional regulator
VPFRAGDTDERILALLGDAKPTAIFAANNLLAEQTWHVLRRIGLRLPEDVSLVGFDDVPWMSMVEPAITAVAQPALEMGRSAALLLLRRLDDPARERTIEVLEPSLVARGSTASPTYKP